MQSQEIHIRNSRRDRAARFVRHRAPVRSDPGQGGGAGERRDHHPGPRQNGDSGPHRELRGHERGQSRFGPACLRAGHEVHIRPPTTSEAGTRRWSARSSRRWESVIRSLSPPRSSCPTRREGFRERGPRLLSQNCGRKPPKAQNRSRRHSPLSQRGQRGISQPPRDPGSPDPSEETGEDPVHRLFHP